MVKLSEYIARSAQSINDISTGVVDPAASTVSFTPPIGSGSSLTSTVTVQLVDTGGSPLTASGGVVSIAVTGSASPSGVVDNGDGTYTATVTNTVEETVTVTASVDGVAIDNTATIVYDQPDIDYSGITNIVMVGASIIEQNYGRDLTTPNADATQRFQANGLNVSVYGYGWSGEALAVTQTKLQEAYAAFPTDNTLFMFHGYGNNVTQTRPFATMTAAQIKSWEDALTGNLDEAGGAIIGLDAIVATRSNRTVLLPITFRRYGALGDETIFNDPSLGSLPYNTNYVNPRMLAINPNAFNGGVPIAQTYEDIRDNRDIAFQADGIHLSDDGELLFEGNAINLARTLIDGAEPPQRIVMSMGTVTEAYKAGFNKIGHADVGLNGVAGTPVVLKYINGADSPYTIEAFTNHTAYGTSGVETNANGADFGSPIFNNTLENNPAFNTSVYCDSTYFDGTDNVPGTITWIIRGPIANANTNINLTAMGSRVWADPRTTQLDCNGTIISFATSNDPPQAPVTAQVTINAQGNIVIVQSASEGTYSYLGALIYQGQH